MPYINSTDAIKYNVKQSLFNLRKENIYLAQTPQGFRFKDIYKLAKKIKTRFRMSLAYSLIITIELNLLKAK